MEEPKYKFITDDGYGTDDIIKNISRIDPAKRFEPGNTVIFFDEIQDFPQISTALKFFKIDGRFDVICSGSLLGINYKKIESNSRRTFSSRSLTNAYRVFQAHNPCSSDEQAANGAAQRWQQPER